MKHTLIFTIAWLGATMAAGAATIDVNSLADDVDPADGECTLREAVTAANTDMPSGAAAGECAQGVGADTLIFSAPAGTLTLGAVLPVVTSELEIDGPSDRSIVVSAANFNVLVFDDGTTFEIPVAVRRLTFSGGTIIITNRELLHVDACLIENANIGVGSTTEGGLLITNTTVTGCSSPVGAVAAAEAATLINSTVTANAVGIQGVFHLINTVVAGNTTTDCAPGAGVRFEAFVGNFIGGACNPAPVDNQGDPMLLPLADNGGPTRTYGLDLDSPLRDAGDTGACLSTDQRGGDRVADGDGVGNAECDIGAVEVASPTSTEVFLESFSVE